MGTANRWYIEDDWLQNPDYFAFKIQTDQSARVAQFFIDHQPNLAFVYTDLCALLDGDQERQDCEGLLNYIKDTYPEIWNYKLEEYQMELKDLKKQITRLEEIVAGLADSMHKELNTLARDLDSVKNQVSLDNQPTISFNKGDVVHSSTGEPIGIALEDSGYVGVGMFSSDALPYRPDLELSDYIEKTEDKKPTNQPSEVVYVFRAKPDSQLHAKLIELLLEWEDDYDLLGSEVSYVFE